MKLVRMAESKVFLLRVMVLALVFFDLAFLALRGIRVAPDSVTYFNLATKFISLGWDVSEFFRQLDPLFMPVTRISYVALTALSVEVLGDRWAIGMIAANLLCSLVSYLLVARFLFRINAHRLTILFCFLLLSIAIEYRMWVTYALSDIPFATCVFGAILFWIECLVDPSRRLTKLLLCLCFGVLALTLRPSGPPLVAAFICTLLWKLLFRQANAKRFDAMIVGGFVLGLASALIITAAAGHYIFLISLQSDIRPELNFVRNYFIEGLVIHDRPETFLAPPTTSWQFMVLALFRLASFFQIIVGNFSWSHNILNALLFVPMYFCALFATVYTRAIWRSRGEFCALYVASFFMTVLVFAVYQSLILIDYDWRYRLPVILPLVALSAVVFDVVVVALSSLWRENARDVS